MSGPNDTDSCLAPGGRVFRSSRFIFPGLGKVRLTVRSNSRSFRCTLHGDVYDVSCPPGVDGTSLKRFLESCALKLPPAPEESLPHYSDGLVIQTPELQFVLERHSSNDIQVKAFPGRPATRILVGNGLDLKSASVTRSISKVIWRSARYLAGPLLLPMAERVAARCGVAPTRWEISGGYNRLGYRSSRGHIALSCALVFMPDCLREYIVCHELAHITEMNHSDRFHRLCNQYCLGRERELESLLRQYRCPVIKL